MRRLIESIKNRPETYAALAASLAAFMLSIFPVFDFDVFWHLANGREMLAQGRIINEEVFSFTRNGVAFHNHEWLSQIILYLLYSIGGFTGLVIFKSLVSGLIGFLLYKTARNAGGERLFALALSVSAVAVGLYRFNTRPQIFSLLFLSLISFVLIGFRSGKIKQRRLYAIPAIMLFWDFLHGAVYGVVIICGFLGGEALSAFLSDRKSVVRKMKPFAWPMAATLALMLASPYGIRSYEIFARFMPGGGSGQNLMLTTNPEFMAMSSFGIWMYPFWIMLALCAALAVMFFRRPDCALLIPSVLFAVLALGYSRAGAAFALVSVPLISHYYNIAREVLPDARRNAFRIASYVLIAALAAHVAYAKFSPRSIYSFGLGLNEGIHPIGAARAVKALALKGNMFNPAHFGGYLAFELYPEKRIFQYAHHTVFSDFPLMTQDTAFIEKYGITYAITGHDEVSSFLFKSIGWVPVYWDGASALYLKPGEDNAEVIESRGLKLYMPGADGKRLSDLEKDPSNLPVLARELGFMLGFTEDPWLAGRLAGMISRPDSGIPASDAIALGLRALDYNGRSAHLQSAVAGLYLNSGDRKSAEFHFLNALRADSGYAPALMGLGFLSYETGDFKKAETYFQKTLRSDRRNPDALYGMGLASLRQERLADARQYFKQCIEAAPGGRWAGRAGQYIRSIDSKGR